MFALVHYTNRLNIWLMNRLRVILVFYPLRALIPFCHTFFNSTYEICPQPLVSRSFALYNVHNLSSKETAICNVKLYLGRANSDKHSLRRFYRKRKTAFRRHFNRGLRRHRTSHLYGRHDEPLDRTFRDRQQRRPHHGAHSPL